MNSETANFIGLVVLAIIGQVYNLYRNRKLGKEVKTQKQEQDRQVEKHKDFITRYAETEIAKQSDRITSLQALVDMQAREISELRADRDDLKQRLSAAEEVQRQRDTHITALETEQAGLTLRIDTLVQEKQAIASERDSAAAQNAAQVQRINELEARVHHLEIELAGEKRANEMVWQNIANRLLPMIVPAPPSPVLEPSPPAPPAAAPPDELKSDVA